MCSPSAGKEATSPHGARAHWQRHDPLSPEGSGRLGTARRERGVSTRTFRRHGAQPPTRWPSALAPT